MTKQIEAMKLALDALDAGVKISPGSVLHDRFRETLAEQPAQQEPVGDEWTPCMKLPVLVHVRRQRPGEAHVSTREGLTPVRPDDLIMRGVSGEEYPIGRAIFEQTYSLDINPPAPAQELVCGWGLFDLHDDGKLFAHCSSQEAANTYAHELSGGRARYEIHPLTIYTTLPAPAQEPCSKCKGLGYYDEGHECDDGSMAGGNYVECEKCKPPAPAQPLTDEEIEAVEQSLDPLFIDVPMGFLEAFAHACIAAFCAKNGITKGGAA